MKATLAFIGFVFAAILILALGSGFVLALAYGLGWLLSRITGLAVLPATMLGVAAILTFIFLADRVVQGLAMHLNLPLHDLDEEYEDFAEDFDDEEAWGNEFDDFEPQKLTPAQQAELDKLYSGIPRWRRPTKSLDFSNTLPDQRCPCGSGKKYKNCHGMHKA